MEGLIMVMLNPFCIVKVIALYCKIFFLLAQVKPLVISKTLKEVEEIVRDNDFSEFTTVILSTCGISKSTSAEKAESSIKQWLTPARIKKKNRNFLKC